MINSRKYTEESHQVYCKGKTVTIRNLTPVYTVQEQEKVKSEINHTLYGIFSKYY